MHKKSKKLTICILFIVCLFATVVPVLAQSQFGLEYATALNLGTRDLRATVMQVINILLGFLGIIAICVMLYGGYLYMMSGGAADKVEKAKKILINGAIGLAIILASYAIAFFIIHALTNATGGGGGCNNDTICDAGESCFSCPGDCDACSSMPPLIGAGFAVSWVDPAGGEADVSLCRLIQMKFNRQINPETIDNNPASWGGSFAVNAATAKTDVNLWVEIDGKSAAGSPCAANNQCASGVCAATCQGDFVPGEIMIWPGALGLTFNNTNDFEINVAYKVTIKSDALTSTGLKNTSDAYLTLGNYTWTFTTGAITDTIPPQVVSVFPSSSSVDVCLTSPIEAAFNEPMDISSLLSADAGSPMNPDSTNSIYLKAPNVISGFNKSVSGSKTLIASPKEPFTVATSYFSALDSDVIRDSCGNYLDGNENGVSEKSAGGDDYPPANIIESAFYNAETAGAANDFDGDDVPKNDTGNNVYASKYAASFTNSNLIPVNTTKHYTLSGKFKSVGTVGSRLYFGLVPYDKDQHEIDAWHVLRVGNDATITSFNATTINVNEVINGWYQAGSMAYQRTLGFYYNGDTTKLPDYVYYWIQGGSYNTNANDGAYNGTTINGGSAINLNNPIPPAVISHIIPGVTVVKNHTSGGTYMYSAAGNATVPAVWTEYKAPNITGEAFGNSGVIFRPGTKYVKILFLANWEQYGPPHVPVAEAELYFDDILFAEVPEWLFTTGNTAICVPEITSVTPAAGNYNDEGGVGTDKITIAGNYFTFAGNLILNNSVDISSSGTNSCILPIAGLNYIPNQNCLISWADHQIQVRVPAKDGASNGASTGNIAVEVGAGNFSNAMPFTVASPHIENLWPNQGGIDQFVTISGSGFGAAKGANDHVYFRRDEDGDTNIEVAVPAELVEANYPCAGSVGWNDGQIIISVPDNVSFTVGEDWYIQVVRDQITNKYWGNLGNFKFIDVVPGPGICSVIPSEGVLDDTVQFSGVRFQDVNPPIEQEVNFGNYTSFEKAKNISSWAYGPPPNPDKVNADVPNLSEGKVGVYLKIDGKNSNTVNFIVHTANAGPKINYFERADGAVGEYVTIFGNGFSAWDGGMVCNAQFSDGSGGWVDGDFAFPEKCGNNFWSDTQIVVKVPAGAATGNIKITTRESLTDDTSDLSPSNFTITAGPAGPGICNITPKGGPLGTSVDIFGERFTGADDVIFFNNKKALSHTLADDENITLAVVPDKTTPDDPTDDAVSGPIIVVDDKNNDGDHNDVGEKSNGYDFAVSDCREATGGCAAIGYPSYECCYDGSCMDPAAGGCNNPSKATYVWNFQTGTYATCGGYGMNQCLASLTCPNSPGQCSPSPAQKGVNTGYNCGNNYCNTSFPIVCAGGSGCAFSNNRCISPGICDIAKDANSIVAGLSGVAKCNNVSGNNYWQTNVPCQSGTYLDINGKCTLGSVSVPVACNPNCADGFSCKNLGGADGACVKLNICPSGSTCDFSSTEADGFNACKSDILGKCECCCRVDHSGTDCCAGLTCEDDACGTDDAVYKYGHCKGCAVWDLGNFFQTLSDDKCGCANKNRVCIANELLTVVAPATRDIGFCGDCGDINNIVYDSDKRGGFDSIVDVEHECKSHGSCCWNSLENSCYTCDILEVVEEACPPQDMSSPSPQKEKTDACLNSTIDIKFNLALDPATLAGGIQVYKCANRSCAASAPVNPRENYPQRVGALNELQFIPNGGLFSNTWYKVVINKNLCDLNGLNLTNNYEWYFKTKDTAFLCAIEKIRVSPEDAVITTYNGTQPYNATPIADCTSLTASNYSWDWQSSLPNIAAITNLGGNPSQTATAQDKDGSTKIIASVPAESKQGEVTLFVLLEDPKVVDHWPDCKEACLNAAMGAKFNMAMAPATLNLANIIELNEWHCGNGAIEAGEDCDDGNVQSGDGCSGIPKTAAAFCNAIAAQEECENKNIDCFWGGAVAPHCKDYSVAASKTECQKANGYWNGATCDNNKGCLNEGSNGNASICGNGIIESGEECDGNPLPQGCDATTCLHTGFVAILSTCGDGKITEGEDCDDGNFAIGDGCSANCLNEGTNQFINVSLGAISRNAVNTAIVDIHLPVGNYFKPNTNYRVFLSDGIMGDVNHKQLTDLNWDFNRDNTNDSFSWSFKTKDKFCNPDTVKVDPAQKVIYSINAAQDYEASIYGSPDSCNPRGQKLNPYSYNWSWSSVDESVATITGSNNWPGCGNEKIEVGEDCDDGNNISGDGCSSVCINEGTTRDMGLVSHWEFNEGSDVFAHDSAGVNDGSLVNGPVWTTGKFGGALSFDGVDDYVAIDAPISSGSPFTISMWYYPTRINVDFDMLYSGTDNIDLQLFFQNGANKLRTSVENVEKESSFQLTAGNINQWHHIVWVYNYISSKVWVDGINVLDTPQDTVFTKNDTLARFGKTLGGAYPIKGIIDDVRIYDKALTGAQVQGIMSQKNYLCGNGVVDFGEDCDGNPFPAGCNVNSCLHTGSLGVCGNSIIETGEDCDDGNAVNGDGCSSTCLNEGTKPDPYTDFYQTVTTKSPGTTNITASVNYCGDAPTKTCGGTLPACATGACRQTTGSGELEVVCGFSNDDSCSKGVCSGVLRCTNNSSIGCTPANETVNCSLTSIANTTCNFAGSSHTCPINKWGGACSVSGNIICYSASDCPTSEFCQPKTDCNYCANNTSFECRAANNLPLGQGNSDCKLGVGYDSCCYSRPIIKSESPDPNFFNPLLNPLALNCNNNSTLLVGSDDYCSAFGVGATCQTYTCQDTNADHTPDSCSAYGRCGNSYCLNNNDCPAGSTCDKSCRDDSQCNGIVCGACRNAQINITFDKIMDPSSFNSDGVCSNNGSQSCSQDSNCSGGICLKNIRLGVKYDDAAISQKNCPSGYYAENDLVYQEPKGFIAKFVFKIKTWFNKLLGRKETMAAEYWCAIPGTITSFNNNKRTTAVFTPQGLKDNLFEDGVTYRVTVKHDVKRSEGVSMGKDNSSDFQYEFTAGDTECQVEAVDVYVGD